MGQTVEQIQQDIIADLVAKAADAGLTITPSEWSDYDYRQLLTFISAADSGILQQLWDAYRIDVESEILSASPQTYAWIQEKMFLFQYDATIPQIAKYDTTTFAPYYENVDPAKRIITNCSVTAGLSGTTSIKIAKGGTTPVALSGLELSAAASYAISLLVPGIGYSVISLNADQLYAAMTVEYLGQYSAVIAVPDGTVVQAIKNYLLSIPFNGAVNMDDLLGVVRKTEGVISVVLNTVSARIDSGAIGTFPLVTANTWVSNTFNTIAGYIITEQTPGSTINDTITYISV